MLFRSSITHLESCPNLIPPTISSDEPEIKIMTEADSGALITFVEMLLRFIYEFPGMVPTGPT